MSNILMLVLNFIFKLSQDWGIAILGLTLIVKFLLLPLSLRQKKSMLEQEDFNKEIALIKEKYKDDEEKQNAELMAFYGENRANLWGILGSFLQIPIMFSLFKVIRTGSIQGSSILLPWISNIAQPDTSYILPLVYTGLAMMPSLINFIKGLAKNENEEKRKTNILPMLVISLMISLKSPVSLVLYFIFSSLFGMLEEYIFNLKYKKI